MSDAPGGAEPVVRFRRLPSNPDLPLPTRATPHAAGYDVRSAVAVELAPGQIALVPTGLVMELPEGIECQVRPRSGLALRHGITLTNSPGTKLRYRLPAAPTTSLTLVAVGMACLLWNGIVAIFVVMALGSFARGEPDWMLTLVLVPFLALGACLVGYLVRLAMVAAGVGPTWIEVSEHPLAPGETVYVRVIDYLDNTVINDYLLDIQIDPVICGDGAAGPGEQCDDGNVANGDGCSSTCTIEGATGEIEPNNTSVQADATGLVSTGNSIYIGAITPVADVDRYRIDLPVASEGFVANTPGVDRSTWEPCEVAAEGMVWMLQQPADYSGRRESMLGLRQREGIMPSRAAVATDPGPPVTELLEGLAEDSPSVFAEPYEDG